MWKFLLAALIALVAIVIIIGGKVDLSQLQNLQNFQFQPPNIPGLLMPTKAVDIRLWPSNFTFTPTIPLNLNISNTSLTNFTGTIYSDFSASKIAFRPAGSQFEITLPINDVEMGSANLTKLSFSNTKLVSANLSVTGEIEIDGFSGAVSIQNSSLRLVGNISKLTAKTDNTTWELK